MKGIFPRVTNKQESVCGIYNLSNPNVVKVSFTLCGIEVCQILLKMKQNYEASLFDVVSFSYTNGKHKVNYQ